MRYSIFYNATELSFITWRRPNYLQELRAGSGLSDSIPAPVLLRSIVATIYRARTLHSLFLFLFLCHMSELPLVESDLLYVVSGRLHRR